MLYRTILYYLILYHILSSCIMLCYVIGLPGCSLEVEVCARLSGDLHSLFEQRRRTLAGPFDASFVRRVRQGAG